MALAGSQPALRDLGGVQIPGYPLDSGSWMLEVHSAEVGRWTLNGAGIGCFPNLPPVCSTLMEQSKVRLCLPHSGAVARCVPCCRSLHCVTAVMGAGGGNV